jgi:hypothetical protein
MTVVYQIGVSSYNFINKEPTLAVIIQGEFVAQRLSSVSNFEQSLGGLKFKDNRDVETVVTRWLKTQGTDFLYQQSMQNSCNYMINVSVLARTMWKYMRIAVQL